MTFWFYPFRTDRLFHIIMPWEYFFREHLKCLTNFSVSLIALRALLFIANEAMLQRTASTAIITLRVNSALPCVLCQRILRCNSDAKVSRTKVCSRIVELSFASFITHDSLLSVSFFIDLLAVARGNYFTRLSIIHSAIDLLKHRC